MSSVCRNSVALLQSSFFRNTSWYQSLPIKYKPCIRSWNVSQRAYRSAQYSPHHDKGFVFRNKRQKDCNCLYECGQGVGAVSFQSFWLLIIALFLNAYFNASTPIRTGSLWKALRGDTTKCPLLGKAKSCDDIHCYDLNILLQQRTNIR